MQVGGQAVEEDLGRVGKGKKNILCKHIFSIKKFWLNNNKNENPQILAEETSNIKNYLKKAGEGFKSTIRQNYLCKQERQKYLLGSSFSASEHSS